MSHVALTTVVHDVIFALPNALVTLGRLGGRPLPTLLVGKGLVKPVEAVGGRERAVAGLVRF